MTNRNINGYRGIQIESSSVSISDDIERTFRESTSDTLAGGGFKGDINGDGASDLLVRVDDSGYVVLGHSSPYIVAKPESASLRFIHVGETVELRYSLGIRSKTITETNVTLEFPELEAKCTFDSIATKERHECRVQYKITNDDVLNHSKVIRPTLSSDQTPERSLGRLILKGQYDIRTLFTATPDYFSYTGETITINAELVSYLDVHIFLRRSGDASGAPACSFQHRGFSRSQCRLHYQVALEDTIRGEVGLEIVTLERTTSYPQETVAPLTIQLRHPIATGNQILTTAARPDVSMDANDYGWYQFSNGNKQWISAECRWWLDQKDVDTMIVPWLHIESLPEQSPITCDDIIDGL